MRARFFTAPATWFIGAVAVAFVSSAPGCTTDTLGTGGAGGSGGSGGSEVLQPGELCDTPTADLLRVRALPAEIFLTPCADGSPACTAREVKVIVDPDVCEPNTIHFETSDEAIVAAPPDGTVDLHRSSVPITLRAGAAAGDATITVHALVKVASGSTADVTTTLTVHVLPAEVPVCAGGVSTQALAGGDTLEDMAGASIALPEGADKPNTGSFIWSVAPFPASIACASDIAPPGYTALGPAVVFGPEAGSFPRDLPLSVPINPALLPTGARQRHIRLAYSGPSFVTPRIVPVADPRVQAASGGYKLSFEAPRLGTYQAVVKADAGTMTRKRRISHRAVTGVSMGGGGTATFGIRHHDLFDVLAPLGGPVDWTWLLHYIENNHLGGFRAIAPGTTLPQIQLQATPCSADTDCQSDERCIGPEGLPPGKCSLMPKAVDPYEHPQTFNQWWYEYPRAGNGGSFNRGDYIQIFRDLGIMFGNPNGENLSKGGENLPAGVLPDAKSQVGDHSNGECSVWVDPLDGDPNEAKQKEIAQNCPSERCSYTTALMGYYDDEYNPDGTFPVISVCDGSPQDSMLTPWANTWTPNGNGYPLEVGLAVDYNGNGVRDELEPIIRAGHERWLDLGDDGKASADEAGYQAGVNEDPAGDDYNPQYNPSGTEGDHRYQMGEPFFDLGLDGVAGTPQQPADGWKQPGDGYDVGEGDGKFTVASGLQRFWDQDPHSIVRKMVDPAKVPGGEMTDTALSRIDVWSDGGLRDLFNFAVDAQHLMGTFQARGRDVSYLNDFSRAPGLAEGAYFDPKLIAYEDMPGMMMLRYGKPEPTKADIDNGSGQHVGTGSEIASRLQAALYFIGSRWRDPSLRRLHQESATKPASGVPECEITGNCTIDFTSKNGRKGPVGITLPPGYGHADLQEVRYPVIYMLHGYGQTPEDLEAAIAFLRNWMNNPLDGTETRLPKAILVYVDGRCRVTNGKAECIRGTFYADSPMEQGAQDEQWWLELMDYVDQHYRTLGQVEVDWTE